MKQVLKKTTSHTKTQQLYKEYKYNQKKTSKTITFSKREKYCIFTTTNKQQEVKKRGV